MKSIFIAAALVGLAVAGIVFYLTAPENSANKIMNVEDGLPTEA